MFNEINLLKSLCGLSFSIANYFISYPALHFHETILNCITKMSLSSSIPVMSFHYTHANRSINHELTIRESQIRFHLQKMCRLPLLLNQVAGLLPLTLDKANMYHCHLFSFPAFNFMFQIIFQLVYLCWYFNSMVFKQSSYQMDSSDTFATTIAYLVFTTGQTLLRITVLFQFHNFIKFHEKLTQLTCKVFNDSTTGKHHQKFLLWIRRVSKNALKWTLFIVFIFGVSLSGTSYIFWTVDFYKTLFNLSPAHVTVIVFSLTNFLTTAILYTFQALWFTVYIQWISICFGSVSLNCQHFLECYIHEHKQNNVFVHLQQIQMLQEIVKEFNILFQVPIIIWLLTTATQIVMQLFFFFVTIKSGTNIGIPFILLAILCHSINLYTLSDTGSSFAEEVSNSVEIVCKCAIKYATLRQNSLDAVLQSDVI